MPVSTKKRPPRRPRAALKLPIWSSCQSCDGAGEVDLWLRSPELAKTAAMLSRTPSRMSGRYWTATALAKKLGIAHTAVCNRLIRLEELGLVTRVSLENKTYGWPLSGAAYAGKNIF